MQRFLEEQVKIGNLSAGDESKVEVGIMETAGVYSPYELYF